MDISPVNQKLKDLGAICHDIYVIKQALYHLNKLPHPSAYNKAQILELMDFLAKYEAELLKIGNPYCV